MYKHLANKGDFTVNHIAVVEDSAQDRAVLDSYLEKYQQEKNCHLQITHFSDGDEIALGYKGGYDLILMDIEMTFMDGMSRPRKSAVPTRRCSSSSSLTRRSMPSRATRWTRWTTF